MEDRSISLDFVEGNIKGVWLKASLDITYKRLFENACKSSQRYPKNVSHGIKIIIFGCFWLEAHTNELLQLILENEISSSKVQIEVWNKLKKNSIEDKLIIFSNILPVELKNRYGALKKQLKQTLDLRGQLAHYKNEYIKISEDVTIKELYRKYLNNLPIPEINRKLMWNEVKIHARTITNSIKWLRKVTRHYHKIKGKRVINKKCKPTT